MGLGGGFYRGLEVSFLGFLGALGILASGLLGLLDDTRQKCSSDKNTKTNNENPSQTLEKLFKKIFKKNYSTSKKPPTSPPEPLGGCDLRGLVGEKIWK